MANPHNDTLDKLAVLEKEFPVDRVSYRGLQIWPYLRVYLVYNQLKPSGFFEDNKSSGRERMGNQVKILLSSVFGGSSRARPLAGLRNADNLFISEDKARNFQFNEKHYHIYEEGWKSVVHEKGNRATCEFVQKLNLTPKEKPFFMNGLILRAMLRIKFSQIVGKKRGEIENWNEFTGQLDKLEWQFPLSEKILKKKLDTLLERAYFAEKMLKKGHVKAVYFIAWFSDLVLPFILAANRLGLKTVELQHGMWSLNNQFAKLPENSYNLLPTHYWAWGSPSLEVLKTLNQHKDHRIVITGFPWMELWKDPGSSWVKQSRSLVKSEYFPTGKSHILVALQPEKDPLPEELLRAFSNSSPDFYWHFRLHPFMTQRQQEINTRLKACNNPHYELDQATSLPLYLLLTKMKTVITMWSTLAIEASAFGVVPVIIHKTGKELFRDEIAQGIFLYAESENEILESIQKETSGKSTAPSNYFETDKTLIDKNLEEFFTFLG